MRMRVGLCEEGRVPFRRTAFELVRRVSECDIPPGEMRDRIGYSIRKVGACGGSCPHFGVNDHKGGHEYGKMTN